MKLIHLPNCNLIKIIASFIFLYTLSVGFNALNVEFACARWITLDDASMVTLSHNDDIYVNKDGSSHSTLDILMEVKNERGKDNAVLNRFTYQSGVDTIKVVDAYTINNGNKHQIEKSKIEDKPLASMGYGFDQTKQILISFPDVNVGSELYAKYDITRKADVTGIYGKYFVYGMGATSECESSRNINIRSEIPLYVEANDPHNALEITYGKNDIVNFEKIKKKTNHNSAKFSELNDQKNLDKHTKYTNFVNIKLTKPICGATINESHTSSLNKKNMTWVAVSSVHDCRQFAKKFATCYERVLAQPLPQLFKQIAQKAEKITALHNVNVNADSDDVNTNLDHNVDIKNEKKSIEVEIKQINTVMALLNEHTKYLGDWLSIDGMMCPHDLDQIANSGVGDCKDFAVATAAILEKMGYYAKVAIIRRGINDRSFENTIPIQSNFNHAIVKVISKSGKNYWIDPTNFAISAKNIFAEIADRPVIILDKKHPSCDRTPKIDPTLDKCVINTDLDIKNGSILSSGHVKLLGNYSMFLTGIELLHSKRSINDMVFNVLSDIPLAEKDKHELIMPDLKSRIIRDIDIQYKYSGGNNIVNTNFGIMIPINRDGWANQIMDAQLDQVSDIALSSPQTVIRTRRLKNILAKNINKLNISIFSPWIDAIRICKYDNNDTVIEDTVQIKEPFIPFEALNTSTYQDIRKKTLDMFYASGIIMDGD